MSALFLLCALLGGITLLAQLVLGLLGVHHDHDVGALHTADVSEGLNLLSVRALSAGVGFFGIAGLVLSARGWGMGAVLAAATAVGGAAMVGVAAAMRSMMRLEDDGTVRIEQAVGQAGRVYVPIPGGREGMGKVHLTLQDRTVELQAVTAQAGLPTGAEVTVVDVVGPDVVEVVATPSIGELLDGSA